MKTLTTFLTFLLFFFGSAQTITQEMGGIDCNFEFTSGSTKLDVVEQQLIQKPLIDARLSKLTNETYSYVVVMQEWYIEFVSNTRIATREYTEDEGKVRKRDYLIILKNSEGGELFRQYIPKDKIQELTGNNGTNTIYTYSINLYGIPRIILNSVAAVDVILIE